MGLYTKYGSRVAIVTSYKANRDLGLFLVQAAVIQPGKNANLENEPLDKLVLERDRFHAGWISNNDLVADGGPEEIIQACMSAPNARPNNAEALLKYYWPQMFGRLDLQDIATAVVQPTGIDGAITRRFGTGMGSDPVAIMPGATRGVSSF